MIRGGGGGSAGGERGLETKGLSRDTWNEGCTLRAGGRLRRTTLGFMTRSIVYGPIYLGANLRDSPDTLADLVVWSVGSVAICQPLVTGSSPGEGCSGFPPDSAGTTEMGLD